MITIKILKKGRLTMKKRLSIVLALILLIATLTLAFASNKTLKFTDIQAGDWYIDHVTKLVKLDGIGGYPDGTFRPNNTITRSEFTTILLNAMGYKQTNAKTGHWATNTIKKAEELKILNKNEFPENSLDRPITRYEMAQLSSKALEVLKEKPSENKEKYIDAISDYNKIPNNYKDYVLEVYTKGIITGYPDKSFGGNKNLTRAESSVVVLRVLEKSERSTPKPPAEKPKKTQTISQKDIERLQNYPLNTIWYANPESALKSYISFDEYYAKYPEDVESIIRKELWTPHNYTPEELRGKDFVWLTSPHLIYNTRAGDYGIRGIVQKSENGKTYEADWEIIINHGWGSVTGDRTLLEHSQRFTDWVEVK